MMEQKKKQYEDIKGMALDEKYKDILDSLRNMPKDKMLRYQWLQMQPQYDEFIVDVMNAWWPDSLTKLKSRLEKYTPNTTIHHEDGLASTKRKTYDPMVFVEAFAIAVGNYTGESIQGKSYTFLKCIRDNYKQEAQKAAGKKDVEEAGITGIVSIKDRPYIISFIRKVLEMKKAIGSQMSIDELIEECECSFTHKFSKRSKEFIKQRIEGLNISESMDQVYDNGDGSDVTIGELIADSKNPYENIEVDKRFFEGILTDFDKKWKLIVDATKKTDRELIKAFLSKDILIALKLEYLSEELRKEEVKNLEPKCGQWCPRTTCLYPNKSRKNGCYIRYKQKGDYEIYKILASADDSFYCTVLDNSYVQYAYQGIVENLDDLFVGRLKPAKGINLKEDELFQFTDAVLGRVLGERSSKVSKCRRYYETETRRELYNIFYNMSDV